MDRDTIIRLAREAGVKPLLYDGKWAVEGLDAFADLVAAHEREVCAALVQANADACEPGSMLQVYLASNAAAIRSRT